MEFCLFRNVCLVWTFFIPWNFHSDLPCWTSFHILVYHLYVFILVIHFSFNQIFVLLSFKCSFCVLDNIPCLFADVLCKLFPHFSELFSHSLDSIFPSVKLFYFNEGHLTLFLWWTVSLIIKIPYLRLFRYFPSDLIFIFVSMIHFELLFVRTVKSVSSSTGYLVAVHRPLKDCAFFIELSLLPIQMTWLSVRVYFSVFCCLCLWCVPLSICLISQCLDYCHFIWSIEVWWVSALQTWSSLSILWFTSCKLQHQAV